MTSVQTVGIIGSGVTGLAASTVLDKHGVQVILLEKEDKVGGHCYTHQYTDRGNGGNQSVAVDLGFMVLSSQTYANFIEWVEQYGVELEDTDMSFSASLPSNQFTWTSNNPFADLSMWRKWETVQLFWDLCRYEKILFDEMTHHRSGHNREQTMAELQRKYDLSDAFMEYFLLPQCGSIWSMPADEIKRIPSEFICEFTYKHSLSCLWGRPVWKTIRNRSQDYVQKIMDKHFYQADHKAKKNRVITSCQVDKLVFNHNGTEKIKIEYDGGGVAVVDHVMFCCHPKYALQILDNSNVRPTPLEQQILGAFECGENTVILHNNPCVMPSSRKMWAAWNYHTSHAGTVNVTYWLNTLQNLASSVQDVFATLNPMPEQRAQLEQTALHVWNTAHPKYNRESWRIIRENELDRIQCVDGRHLSFAGAWSSFGFHRDGFLSGTKEAFRILSKTYRPKQICIQRGTSYWFSYLCFLLHQVISFILSIFLRRKKRD